MFKKTSPDLLEFLPAALEIQAAPPPLWSRGILWTLLALLIAAILWASVGKIDIVAVAQGKLVPSGKVKLVQSAQAGSISQIRVQEGQRVNAGEVLFHLDSSINAAEQNKLQNQLNTLRTALSADQALLHYSRQHSFPASTVHTDLLSSKTDDYNAQLAALQAELTQLQAEKTAAQVNIGRLDKTLAIITQRAQSLKTLNEQQLIATDQFLQLEQNRVEQQETLAYEHARLQQINATMDATEKRQRAFVAEFQKNLIENSADLQQRIHSIEQEYAKSQVTARQQTITAPVSGTVTQLAITTLGAVVNPAQELLQIVPNGKNGGLLVEAGLPNKDIGFVTANQSAEIKLEAFPFTQFGVIEGEIIHVSADAINHEQQGLIFPITTRLKQQQIYANGTWINLQPGMQASVEIKTGERRIIEFLLNPLLKGLDEGGRER